MIIYIRRKKNDEEEDDDGWRRHDEKGYKSGGKLKMVEKDGKMVPFYAADGKGKMAAGTVEKKRGKKKEDKKKAAMGDRGFQGRAAARDLAKFKEKRGRIGGASRGATGGAMGGGGGIELDLWMPWLYCLRRMKEGGMAKKGYAGGGMTGGILANDGKNEGSWQSYTKLKKLKKRLNVE